MNKRTKKERGITLIALVITIIVLLILAGVSIAMLTGDNGILTKATEAKQNTEKAEIEEQVRLAVNASYDNSGNLDNAQLKENLNKIEGITKIDTVSFPQKVTIDGYQVTINSNGTVENAIKTGETPTTPTTPEEPESPVVKTALENAEAAKPSGANLTVTDASKGIVMVDSNNNEWVWIEVPDTVFSEATKTNPSSENIKTDLIAYATDYREGKTGQGLNWTDEWYSGCGIEDADTYNTMYQTMLSSVYENKGFYIGRYEAGIAGSDTDVSKARTSHTEITSSSPKAVSKVDQIPYNFVTCSEAQNLSSNMATGGKTSSLMFGIQWDLVCKYLEEKANLEIADIKTDSTDWGNYKNKSLTLKSGKYNINPGSSSSTWTAFDTDTENYVTNKTTSSDESYKQLLTTGASEDTNKMNIYDLAGNEFEWTLEKTSSADNPCALRGGEYVNDGSYGPASRRDGGYTTYSSNSSIAFRFSLY